MKPSADEASKVVRFRQEPSAAARPLIVGIGGTTRDGSSCEASMLYALRCAAEMGVEVQGFAGADLRMPVYDPQVDARDEASARLVAALRRADGVIICSPGYHGLISGMLKNALDYIEDMRADDRPYLDGRAVGCIVSANGAQALGSTLASLRAIVHALRGWPTPYGATLMAGGTAFADGVPVDADVRGSIGIVVRQVVDFARMSAAWKSRCVPATRAATA